MSKNPIEYNPFTNPILTNLGQRTEKKTIKVVCCTMVNPVYLRFRNSLGGIDYVMFDRKNTETIEVATESKFEKPLTTLENGNKLQVQKKTSYKVYYCQRDFKLINYDGYADFLKSEHVQIYENETWINVDVEKQDFTKDNTAPYGKISIKIIFATNER
jgi:hypothetical protein